MTVHERFHSDLLKMVTNDRDNYQGAAVVAAEAELAIRNLVPGQIEAAQSFNEKQQQIQAFKANTTLDTHWKFLTFIFS